MTLFLIALCATLALLLAWHREDNHRLRSQNTVQAIALAAERRKSEKDEPWRPLPPWAVRHSQPALPAASQPALPAASEATGDLLAVPFLTEPPPPDESGWIPQWRDEDGWMELTPEHFDRDDRPQRLRLWPGRIEESINAN